MHNIFPAEENIEDEPGFVLALARKRAMCQALALANELKMGQQ
jgi:hypothetical protein